MVDGFIVGPKIIGNKGWFKHFLGYGFYDNFWKFIWYSRNVLGTPILSIIKLFYVDLLKRAEQGGKEWYL